MPAVVNISTSQKVSAPQFIIPELQIPGMPQEELEQFQEFFRRFAPEGLQERKMNSLGSGFVIDSSGYVVTNNHVIADADEVTVKFSDSTELQATIVGRDPSTDLALLKVEPKTPLVAVSFGNSDALRVGDWVITIGNPFGLGGSVTAGIISATGRDIYSGPFDDFLQTDAAINRGSSGGPLFNTDGEVVGINTAIFSPSGGNIGIGFSVPSTLAEPVIEQLKKFGHARRGWLGVKIQTVTEEIAESLGLPTSSGALVVDVTPGSPAAKANIVPGDVIVSFDGRKIQEMRKLPRYVAGTPIGESAKLEVWSGGKFETRTVLIEELKDGSHSAAVKPQNSGREKSAKQNSSAIYGMELAAITPELREEFGVPDSQTGVIVLDASFTSEARQRGIRSGDVISQVNDKYVTTPQQVKSMLDGLKASGKNNALVRVVRETEGMFITLPL
jgi:serine protease Do